MRSRQLEGDSSYAIGGGNDRRKAGDSGTVGLTLGGGEGLLQWSSGEKNHLNRLLSFPSRSSVLQLHQTATN
jgi:hypothetical protein